MERDEEVVFGKIFLSFKGGQHSKRNLWCKVAQRSPYMNIGNVLRNYVQAVPIIKLVSSYLSNISMRTSYPLIGA